MTDAQLRELGIILCKIRLEAGRLRFYEEGYPINDEVLKKAGFTPELKEALEQHNLEEVRRDSHKNTMPATKITEKRQPGRGLRSQHKTDEPVYTEEQLQILKSRR